MDAKVVITMSLTEVNDMRNMVLVEAMSALKEKVDRMDRGIMRDRAIQSYHAIEKFKNTITH